jgi:hypothetical protein
MQNIITMYLLQISTELNIVDYIYEVLSNLQCKYV